MGAFLASLLQKRGRGGWIRGSDLSDAGGKRAGLEARLVSVDNARESVDKDGRILGIIASETGSGRLDQGIRSERRWWQTGRPGSAIGECRQRAGIGRQRWAHSWHHCFRNGVGEVGSGY